MHNDDKKNTIISDTLIISAIPAIAYGIAFFFERGYLGAFGLPDFIITVSIERFFFALSVLMGVFIILMNILDFFFGFIPEDNNYNWRLILSGVLLIMFPLLAIYQFFFGHLTWVIGLAGVTGLLGIFFVYIQPLIEAENLEDYFAKLQESDQRDRDRASRSLTSRIANKIGPGFYITAMSVLLLMPIVAGYMGTLTAQRQTKYLATEIDGKEFALIRTYNDLFIYAEASREWIDLYNYKYRIGNTYQIRELKDLNGVFYPRFSVSD